MGEVIIKITYSTNGNFEMTENVDDAGEETIIELADNAHIDSIHQHIRSACSDVFGARLDAAITVARS